MNRNRNLKKGDPVVTNIEHIDGGKHIATEMIFDTARCDFCDRQGVELVAEYLTEVGWEVDLGMFAGIRQWYIEENGQWVACKECAALIDAGDPEDLIAFNAEQNKVTSEIPCRIQEGFWKHKLPEKIDYTKGDADVVPEEEGK